MSDDFDAHYWGLGALHALSPEPRQEPRPIGFVWPKEPDLELPPIEEPPWT